MHSLLPHHLILILFILDIHSAPSVILVYLLCNSLLVFVDMCLKSMVPLLVSLPKTISTAVFGPSAKSFALYRPTIHQTFYLRPLSYSHALHTEQAPHAASTQHCTHSCYGSFSYCSLNLFNLVMETRSTINYVPLSTANFVHSRSCLLADIKLYIL